MGFSGLSVTQWEIVRDFVNGNIEAGVQTLGKYSPAIRGYLERKGFKNEADDIMQPVYLKIIAWVKREDFDEDKGSFRGMIIHCTHQAMADEMRRRGGKPQETELEYEPVSKPDMAMWHEIYYEELLIRASSLVKERVDETTWLAFIAMFQEGKSAEGV